MNIVVCIKQVIDPETPVTSFKIDATSGKAVSPPGIAPVLDPYSEYALEAALRLKEAGGGKVTALCLGKDLVPEVVKKTLAMGADELILLEDETFADGDSYSTAYALSKAIEKISQYDLILCGRQASDWDAGQVGSGIAELLELPCITVAQKIEAVDSGVKVERATDNGYEVIESPLPALVTISNEIGEVRYPNIKGILASKKKQSVVWSPADIGVEAAEIGDSGRRSRVVKLYQLSREGKCQMIEADNPEEAAAKLALKLREDKLI